MAKKDWKYQRGGGGYGTMVCCSCHKDASGKQFRVYQDHSCKDRGFVVQCRECSADAKGWKDLDDWITRRSAELATRIAAFMAFAKEWDTASLDEDIEQYESDLHGLQNTTIQA